MGTMPCAFISAWSAASLRRASRPPWIFGCSVLTRPPRSSGAPVKSCTCFTVTPSLASSAALPPVERISMPRAVSPRASSTIPVLSETLIKARATVMRGSISHLLVLFVGEGARLVVGDHPQLCQAAHLQLPDALAGQIHDHAHFFQGDPGAIGHVQGAGLRQLPQLLVGEVHLHRAGA